MVADIEEMENFDASEFHASRLDAKEIFTSKKVNILFHRSQLERQNCVEEIAKFEMLFKGRINL